MEIINSTPYLLAQIATSYKVLIDKSLKQVGLHGGQVFILFQLWETDGQTQIQLANQLNLSPPTINKMIASLQNNTYVRCVKDEVDSRQVRIFITNKGQEIKESVELKWREIETILTNNFSETEKLILGQLIEKLVTNLNS